ncbi:MAG: 1-acyl-sn-glycerol-3-phosphate acyltransferase [Pseudomonadota bacterium]
MEHSNHRAATGPPTARPLNLLIALLFDIQVYASMAFLAVFFTPWALVDRRGAFAGIRTYCRWIRFSAKHMIGLESQIRGTVPSGEVLVASKHQSFFDIILLCSVLPRPKFIMKSELRWAPILGWFALRIGCVPVVRGKRSEAVAKMLADVAAGRADPGQLVIYPQGTRVPVGEKRDYKVGAGLLYEQLGGVCVPAATNVGVFWPKRGFRRRSGLAVLEFLPEIEKGLEVSAFMARLEDAVETRSDALVQAAEHP